MIKRVALLGFTKTGKTTYLAALWQSLRAPGTTLDFTIDSPPPERRYLSQISSEWLAAKEITRSPLTATPRVDLTIRSKTESEAFSLTIPDVRGESYEQELADRQLSAEMHETLEGSDAYLLFLHPRSVVQPSLIEDGIALAKRLPTADEGSASEGAPQREQRVVPWSFEFVPTEAAVVELLQTVEFVRGASATVPIAIMISAWDLLRELYNGPNDYISAQLPFLSQYMIDAKWARFRCYGITAQGGDYKKDRDDLLAKSPWQRPLVVDEDGNELNVLSPILDAFEHDAT